MTHEFVKIVEVSPRDGLQNEATFVPTDIKLAFIQQLVDSGLSMIEATSFVSPKWVPQMADHREVVLGLPHNTSTSFPVLVPNKVGLENALACGVKEIAVFAAASESFSKKNINCSIEESIQRYQEVITIALQNHIKVRGYVSCVLGCPYEGEINAKAVQTVAKKLFDAGCYEISLGDTIGVGTPKKAQQMLKTCSEVIPMSQLAVHFHDTYGQALANIYACIEAGVRTVDASVSGLGGCPYAKGASGNVATEEVVYMLEGLGLKTGIDLNRLIDAGKMMCDTLKRPIQSKVAVARLSMKEF